MSLDLAVTRAVAQSQLLERALHSQRPWYVQVGSARVLAARQEHRNGVTFTARFPAVADPNGIATLYEQDIARSAIAFDGATDAPFALDWDLTLEESLRV